LYYAGIDIAKRSHEVCLTNGRGEILGGASFNITNTLSGVQKLLKTFDAHQLTPDNCHVGMEATGHYWQVLYTWLTTAGYDVKVINPIVTNAYRRMNVRKAKTDRIDAELVAKAIRDGEYQETRMTNDALQTLRQLCRHRQELVGTRSALKQKALVQLDTMFPEYERLFHDPFCKSSIKLLKTCCTPDEIGNMSTRELTNLLSQASRGYFGEEKAIQIKAAARETIGIRIGVAGYVYRLQNYLEDIEYYDTKIGQAEAEIEQLMEQLDTHITTIPGIGLVNGACIVAEIGDIDRFRSTKSLVAFAGLDPSVHESGEFQGTNSSVSKRGSPHLRHAIWQSAFVASHSDPQLSAFYQGLKARGKAHRVAVGAVARKLCHLIYAVLSENRPYEVRHQHS